MRKIIQYVSKIYQITNLQFLPLIVHFSNWISDTFCANCCLGRVDARLPPRPPQDEATETRTGIDDRALLSTRPNRNTRHFLSGPPPMESTPISVCSQAVIHKVGYLRGAKTPVRAKRVHAVASKKFTHLACLTFKIGREYGFLLH